MGYNQISKKPVVDSSKYAVPEASNNNNDDTEDGSATNDDNDTESGSSYAGSGEYLTDDELSPVAYFDEAFSSAFDPSKLDRAIAIQAQTSGLLNSKSKEIQQLQADVAERLGELKALFTEGMKNAKTVQKDLDWIHKRIQVVSREAKKKYPIEYTQAREELIDD